MRQPGIRELGVGFDLGAGFTSLVRGVKFLREACEATRDVELHIVCGCCDLWFFVGFDLPPADFEKLADSGIFVERWFEVLSSRLRLRVFTCRFRYSAVVCQMAKHMMLLVHKSKNMKVVVVSEPVSKVVHFHPEIEKIESCESTVAWTAWSPSLLEQNV